MRRLVFTALPGLAMSTASTQAADWLTFMGDAAHGMFGQPRDGHRRADPRDFYRSSPLVTEGRAVFGSSDGHVYALDAATGQLRWRHDAKGSWMPGTHVRRLGAFIASPVWMQGQLIVADALGRVRAFRPMAKS